LGGCKTPGKGNAVINQLELSIFLIKGNLPHSMCSALSIAVIIPAYNEAGRVCRVLSTLREVDFLTEILVINDGSTDATIDEARQIADLDRRFRILNHQFNQGKGQAIFHGLSVAYAPVILMLDADLLGLTHQHIRELVQPVLVGNADMTLGLFRDGHWLTDLSHQLTPWLTGQRCLRKELFQSIPPKAAAGYGIETALTVASSKQGWRCQRITLWGVSHVPSEFHRGYWQGIKTRLKMYKQILRAWYLMSSRHDLG
jgi:polyisoprenyl-phosphate glycosyltransferase